MKNLLTGLIGKIEGIRIIERALRIKGKSIVQQRHGSRSKYKPHQGKRECARRRGEIGWRAHHAE